MDYLSYGFFFEIFDASSLTSFEIRDIFDKSFVEIDFIFNLINFKLNFLDIQF